jgi:hypothetical protein
MTTQQRRISVVHELENVEEVNRLLKEGGYLKEVGVGYRNGVPYFRYCVISSVSIE